MMSLNVMDMLKDMNSKLTNAINSAEVIVVTVKNSLVHNMRPTCLQG